MKKMNFVVAMFCKAYDLHCIFKICSCSLCMSYDFDSEKIQSRNPTDLLIPLNAISQVSCMPIAS